MTSYKDEEGIGVNKMLVSSTIKINQNAKKEIRLRTWEHVSKLYIKESWQEDEYTKNVVGTN